MKRHLPIAGAAIAAAAGTLFPSLSAAQTSQDMTSIPAATPAPTSSRSGTAKLLPGKAIGSWFPD